MPGSPSTIRAFYRRLPPRALRSMGLVDDWAGVDPLALDEQGDDSPLFTGDDLRAVYVAQSSQDLFVRVDLWETVNTNFGNGPVDEEYGRYNIVIENVGSFPRIDLGIAFDVDAGGWSVGHNGASSQVPDGLEGTHVRCRCRVGDRVRRTLGLDRQPFRLYGGPGGGSDY